MVLESTTVSDVKDQVLLEPSILNQPTFYFKDFTSTIGVRSIGFGSDVMARCAQERERNVYCSLRSVGNQKRRLQQLRQLQETGSKSRTREAASWTRAGNTKQRLWKCGYVVTVCSSARSYVTADLPSWSLKVAGFTRAQEKAPLYSSQHSSAMRSQMKVRRWFPRSVTLSASQRAAKFSEDDQWR